MGGLLPKPRTEKEVEDGAGSDGRHPYGVSSMQGWRVGMEDAHLALPDFEKERHLGLFGVFDGHGGAAVSRVAAQRLPGILQGLKAFKEARYGEALYEAFLKLDAYLASAQGRAEVLAVMKTCPEPSGDEEEVARLVETGAIDKAGLQMLEEEPEEEDLEEDDDEVESNKAWTNGVGPDGQGSTAVVALVCGGPTPEVFVANAGDSRCVLARGSKAVALSRDHKPTLKVERRRILQAGGFVSAEGRVDGNLNLSRAFGDFAYKSDKRLKATEQKISCEAEVRSRALTDTDQYLVLGCDGIFEKYSNQALLDFLLPLLRKRRSAKKTLPLSTVCSRFLDVNIAKRPDKEQGLGCDNMTLLVVDLHPVKEATATQKALRQPPPRKPKTGSTAGSVRRSITKGGHFPVAVASASQRRRMLLQLMSGRSASRSC